MISIVLRPHSQIDLCNIEILWGLWMDMVNMIDSKLILLDIFHIPLLLASVPVYTWSSLQTVCIPQTTQINLVSDSLSHSLPPPPSPHLSLHRVFIFADSC